MGAEALNTRLQGLPGLLLRPEESMAKHTPLRVGGPVELWVEAQDEQALQRLLSEAKAAGGKWRVHWPFGDWLVRDGGLKGTVIRLGHGFEIITVDEETVTMGAAALWSALPGTLQGGIWDAIRSWPGTVGGTFEQGNASQLSGLCTQVQVMRSQGPTTLNWADDGPPPKVGDTSVLSNITLRRVSAARSWLMRPIAAGQIFEDVQDSSVEKELTRSGVLGTRLRRWRLSSTAPGTIVHLGGGTFSDLQMLVKGVRMRVEKTRGVTLQTRIPVLGNEPGKRNR
jgi:UDP-N-acetylenolpyruvoylglucosamine reductase